MRVGSQTALLYHESLIFFFVLPVFFMEYLFSSYNIFFLSFRDSINNLCPQLVWIAEAMKTLSLRMLNFDWIFPLLLASVKNRAISENCTFISEDFKCNNLSITLYFDVRSVGMFCRVRYFESMLHEPFVCLLCFWYIAVAKIHISLPLAPICICKDTPPLQLPLPAGKAHCHDFFFVLLLFDYFLLADHLSLRLSET